MKSRSVSSSAVIIFLLLAFHSYSQVQTPRPVSISSACGGFYEHLPQGYSSNTTQNYPLIVAIHGIGELGNGTTDLPSILNCWTALPRLIENGAFPTSFTVGAQSFSFIVISPQFRWWPAASDVNAVVDYAVKNYRIDQSRIYVTGLSMGGGATWDFAGAYPTKAAAIVPICGAAGPDATRAQAMASAQLGVWATHNENDPIVSSSNTTGWVNLLRQYNADVQSNIFNVSGHDAWTKTYDPNFTQNGVNIYQWMLMHKKGNSPPPPNQLPTANAGADQTITLPQNSVTLNGSGADSDGTVSSFLWSQLSGPSQTNITDPSSASTAVNNLSLGIYVFTLKITDNQGGIATSNVTITVNPIPNQPPKANAGSDQIITLPQNSVTLSGSGSDPDGNIAIYEWRQASGPAQATIVSTSSASTIITNLVQGTYVFSLILTDDKGANATSNVTITVNAVLPPSNQLPTANAGANQTITLPINSVNLNGSGSDPDGTIASYQWTQESGPSQADILSPTSANTVASNLTRGNYIFTLKITDDKGAIATSNVTIAVNASPNQLPTANAGADQTITLPQNSVTLNGSGADSDGTVSSFLWSQLSGPSQTNITDPSSASTAVNNLSLGIYVFTLKITDNQGGIATSNVTITVNPIPNQPPKANAGSDQIITLPVNFTILHGAGSDADGIVSSYQWSQIAGPQANIKSAYTATTLVDSLKQGVYTFRLTVIDEKGSTEWDDVSVTVNRPPNQAPIANAGSDQTITLPDNSVELSGSVSDPDGTIITFQWTQTSGPTKSNFSSTSPLALTVKNLAEGIYTFRLTVTDNDGATAWNDVRVTVLPDPRTESTAKLYPNPARDVVYLKIDAITLQNNSVIQITNAAGNIMYKESFVRTGFRFLKQVDISKLPNGIYYLSINTDIQTNKTLVFIKQ